MWEENAEAVDIFLRAQTQWNIGAMGGFIGLNYPAIIGLIELFGKADKLELFDDIQAMEYAALKVLRKAEKNGS